MFNINIQICICSNIILQKLWRAIGTWLQQAQNRPNVSVSFGPNQWEDMHGGGTCIFPHCRPQGLYNPRDKTWNVRLFWQPDQDKKSELVIESFTLKSTVEPTVERVYSALEGELDKVKW